MDKQGNHKQSLPESADPELEALLELEAERLMLESLLTQ